MQLLIDNGADLDVSIEDPEAVMREECDKFNKQLAQL